VSARGAPGGWPIQGRREQQDQGQHGFVDQNVGRVPGVLVGNKMFQAARNEERRPEKSKDQGLE